MQYEKYQVTTWNIRSDEEFDDIARSRCFVINLYGSRTREKGTFRQVHHNRQARQSIQVFITSRITSPFLNSLDCVEIISRQILRRGSRVATANVDDGQQ